MMLLVDTKVDVQYKDGGARMERIPNAVYTKELREEAVKMITEGGLKYQSLLLGIYFVCKR